MPPAYTTEDILIRLAAGLVIGFCIGLTGVGGGVLMMPTLSFLGFSPTACVGTASVYSFLTRCSATLHYAKLKTIDYRTSILFLVGAVPSAMLVGQAINRYVAESGEEEVRIFQANLKLFISGMVFLCVLLLVINLVQTLTRKSKEHEPSKLSLAIKHHPVLRNITAPALGIVVGALMGSTSIGGGVLIVPILILVFGLSSSMTVGTSVFISVVPILATAITYLKGGQADIGTAVLMAAGSLSGVSWGSKLSVAVPEKLLKTIMVIVILIAAILMVTSNGGGN